MKFFKWKIFIITSIVCLLPVLLGVALWDNLPDKIAIHFDINNNPDNFGNKGFVVFGLPIIMVIFQGICCVVNDFNAKKYGEVKKVETITKWIVPVVSIVMQLVTLGIALEKDIDVRMVAALLVGGILIVTGNYLPKLNYVKNYKLDAEKAKKLNRFVGFEMVILGMLFIISIFFPPVATAICVFALIPFTIISIIYRIKVEKNKTDA